MATSKRQRQRASRPIEKAPEGHDDVFASLRGSELPHPTRGTWSRVSDLDASWVFEHFYPLLDGARPALPTMYKMATIAVARAHLPAELRAPAAAVPDVRWRRGR